MRVTLINTDAELWASGMRSIAATLRQAGVDTTMVYAGSPEAVIDDAVIERLAEVVADSSIIGVSSMSRGSARAKRIIAGLRPLGRLIVWGGVHPTLNAKDCATHADIVCRGEGEGFMLELVERLSEGRGYEDIENGVLFTDGRTVVNEMRPLIEDLDALPFPAFDFEDKYVLEPTGELVPNTAMRDADTVLFSGSRGCLNACAYCSNSQLMSMYRGKGRYARKMSVAAFVAGARRCRDLFPKTKRFYFTDEDFFARPVEEMRELAAVYQAEVGLPYECMASPRQITAEKVRLAADAGMWRIDVGLESGSERTRRTVFNRHVDDDTQMRAAFDIVQDRRVVVYYFLILGNPYEEREDFIAGIDLLRRMPTPYFLRAYNLVFIPGTKLYDRACADGVISGVDDSAFDIDFLAGYDYSTHEWKRKNLYLNGLISLMVGKAKPFRLGFVPRFALPLLTSRRVVDFADRHEGVGRSLVALAAAGLTARRSAVGLAERLLGDSRIAYGLTTFFARTAHATGAGAQSGKG